MKGHVFPDGKVHVTEPPADMEEREELKDALSPIYDQLVLQPMWDILEVLPLRVDKMGLDGTPGVTHWSAMT